MTLSKKVLAIVFITGTILSAQTIATVNGSKITSDDLNDILVKATQGKFSQLQAEKQNKMKDDVLQQLIAKELIFDDAKKKGTLKSSKFEAEYNKIKIRLKKELAVQIWQQEEFEKVKISDKVLKDYYKNNMSDFIGKASVQARHILLKDKVKALSLLSKLSGLKGSKLKEKFIEMAKKNSTGPTKVNGGDLGIFKEGQMVPNFNTKAFSMKEGTVSDPVTTQFGQHLIYLEKKFKAKTMDFQSVKSSIYSKLKLEEFKKVMSSKMKSLREKAIIK